MNHEPITTADLNSFQKIIETRRSVRIYTQTPIDESVVKDCLRLAQLAPNSSNLQPWEFYWVKNKAKKEQLITACLSQPTAKTAAELFVAVARTGTWRAHAKKMHSILKEQNASLSTLAYYQKLIPFFMTLGPINLFGGIKKLLYFGIGLFRPIVREPTQPSDIQSWAIKSTALACENLMLAFCAHGYDTCAMEGIDSLRIKKLLHLPRDAKIVMVISAGKRLPEGVYGPRIRFPLEEEFIHVV